MFEQTSINSGQILKINDFEMYYEIHGEGPPILLLHGFTGSAANLIPYYTWLAKTHQVIFPDLRGHGRSTTPSEKFSFSQAALDVWELLNQLKIDQFSAIGFSGGGCTLLHMATQQPERIKAMALISATSHFTQETRDIMRQYTVESRTPEEWGAMRKIHLHGDEQIRMLWQQARDFSESYDDMNFTPADLAMIKAKTLIVQGDSDPLYPLEVTIDMYQNIPDSQLWVVPNAGHVPISDANSQQFIHYLTQLLII